MKRDKETGECLPRPRQTSTCRKLDLETLRQDVQSSPELFQSERASRFGVCQATISNALAKLGLTRKNKTTGYLEQDEEQKPVFLKHRPAVAEGALIYLDDGGLPQTLYREYGGAPKGEKVFGISPGKREQKFNLIAAAGQQELFHFPTNPTF